MVQNNLRHVCLAELTDIKLKKSVALLNVDKRKMDLLANPVFKAFLAGSFSGTCTTILFQPLDLVKTRIQSSKADKKLGMFSVARQVLETERLPGLWRGMVPSIAYSDFTLTYNVNKAMTAYFNVQNVFNQLPPAWGSAGATVQMNFLSGYPLGDDLEGRYMTLGFRFKM